ncbi:TetR/AcrR family transcriptional regulator C-terminal domain-containing protein [Streptomyces sp. CoH27]|uniref:TetR/AcrR family transcriptional regulator C-terminal domain-containing protein n=1 Tax=Streptomyces sp. CoH27 TaxID=2875763 RepID=UPI001CD237F3|nr:TetR/AcrR family transcriptional regulator C-terminal domain-containing protein [Streptomyces sp. CoH27]
MTVTEGASSSGARRTRGRRAGIDLPRIIEAARSLDADTVTMQAVADKLGVDRKAVNHHVSDRESLLRLLALDSLSRSSSAVEIPAEASWQEACRIYATAFTESLIAADALAEHLMPDDSLYAPFIEPAEALAGKLTKAGFDDEAAVRSLALLTNLCWAYARDAIHVSRSGERLRPRLTRELVADRDPEAFEHLARIVERGVDTYDVHQLELSIEVFVRGIEAVLLGPGSGWVRRV